MIDRTRLSLCIIGVLVAAAACIGPAATQIPSGTGIEIRATAGPGCPVERQPPDPGCAPRPVAGAPLVIRTGAGAEVIRGTTDGGGVFRVALAPGDYVVVAEPVDGMVGVPDAAPASVVEGAVTAVELAYDTGIR